jgi:hypothetical protein
MAELKLVSSTALPAESEVPNIAMPKLLLLVLASSSASLG